MNKKKNYSGTKQQVQTLKQLQAAIDALTRGIQQLAESSQNIDSVTQDMVQSLRVSQQQFDNVQKKIDKISNSSYKQLAKQIGNVDDDIINHSKNLINLAQDYNKLSVAGRVWLSSINFSGTYKMMSNQLKKYNGQFVSAYTKMNNLAMGLAGNMNKLGQAGFSDMVGSLRQLDKQLQKLQDVQLNTKTSSQLRAEFEKLHNIQTQINQAADSGHDMSMQQYQTLTQQKMQLQKGLDKLKQVKQVSQQQLLIQTQKLNALKAQRQHMQQMVKLQNSLNAALKPFMQQIDSSAEQANGIKNAFFSLFSVGNISFPGISQLKGALDFKLFAQPIKGILSQSVSMFAMGFKTISKRGKSTFKELAAAALTGFHGIGAGIIGIFSGIFKTLLTGFMSVIIALFTAAMQRRQQLQSAYMNAQQSAGAISGPGQKGNFGALYGKLGGLYGGQKAAEMYKVFRKVTDTLGQAGNQVQFLNRKLGVSATTASTLLQNLQYVYGMSSNLRGNFAKLVAIAANMQGVLPQRVLSDMAEATGQTTIYLAKNPKALAKSALFAAKMNMSMQDMLKAAKGLDDIQKSIQKSMQIQLMTGQQLDIGQMIRLKQLGKGPEAVAMMFDQLGPAINTSSTTVKNALSQMMGGMDYNVMLGAYEQSKKSGLSFQQQLARSGVTANEIMERSAQGMISNTNTSAWALLTSMGGLQNEIANIIHNHFGWLVTWFYDNKDKLLVLFQKFVKAMSEMLKQIFVELQKPQTKEALKDLFNDGLKFAQKLIDHFPDLLKLLSKMLNMLLTVYKHGGIAGLLGLGVGLQLLKAAPGLLLQLAVAKLGKGAPGIPGVPGGGGGFGGAPDPQNTGRGSGNSKQRRKQRRQNQRISSGTKPPDSSQSIEKASKFKKFAKDLADIDWPTILKAAAILAIIGLALFGFAYAIKPYATLDMETIGKAFLTLGVMMGVLAVLPKILKGFATVDPAQLISMGISLAVLGGALYLFALAIAPFNEISWDAMAKAGATLVGVLASLAILTLLDGKKMLIGAAAMILMGVALYIISKAMLSFTKIKWGDLAKAAVVLVVFTAAIFGLGALIMGPGFVLFIAGVAGMFALAAAMYALGAAAQSSQALVPLFDSIFNGIATIIIAVGNYIEGIILSISASIATLVTAVASALDTVVTSLTDSIVRIGSLSSSNIAAVGVALVSLATGIGLVAAALVGGGIASGLARLLSGKKTVVSQILSLSSNSKDITRAANGSMVLARGLESLSKQMETATKLRFSDAFLQNINAFKSKLDSITPSLTSFTNALNRFTAALTSLSNLNRSSVDRIINSVLRINALQAIQALATTIGSITDRGALNALVRTMSLVNTNVMPHYGQGGIVSSPTVALIGQSGPEAIVPLRQSAYAGVDSDLSEPRDSFAYDSVINAIKQNGQRPINIVLQLDGRPIAQYLIDNSVISNRLG